MKQKSIIYNTSCRYTAVLLLFVFLSGCQGNVLRKNRMDEADAYNRRGMVLYQSGRCTEAEEEFTLALKADPGFAPALDNMGFCCFYRGDDQEAMKYFDRSLKADPGFPDSHLGRGMVLARTERFDEALKEFDRAIELKKDYPDPYFERGIIRTDRFELEAAIGDFSRAVELNPRWISPLFERGLIYYHQGRFREAGKDFEEALKIKTPSGDSRGRKVDLTGHLEILRGLCLYHLKEPGWEEFLKRGLNSLKNEPAGEKSFDGRGFALILLGELKSAEEILRTDREMLHRDYSLALVLLKTGREREAAGLLKKASQELPPLWEKSAVDKLLDSMK